MLCDPALVSGTGESWVRRWLDPHWYRYLWQRMSVDLKAVVLLLTLSGAGAGGFFAFEAVGATASQGTTAAYVPMTTTVQKLVRVLEHGHVVVKRVPVVKRVFAKPITVKETRTIQTPNGPRVVTRNVVHYQTVYRKKVITVHGKPVTVNEVVTDTQMLTDTQLLTVTNERIVGQTVVQQVTNEHTATVSQTVVNERTVTLQPDTQTVVMTAPADTVTVHDTVTVTTPGDTVTVTTGP
jgi:hypothetical protein